MKKEANEIGSSSASLNKRPLFEIVFPPGPMGLELEPVITSSERQIGCRVKDYYIGIDHKGIDPELVKAKVRIGDIIFKIGQENVLSAKFDDILDKLKSLRDTKRSIIFKDLSTGNEFIHTLAMNIISSDNNHGIEPEAAFASLVERIDTTVHPEISLKNSHSSKNSFSSSNRHALLESDDVARNHNHKRHSAPDLPNHNNGASFSSNTRQRSISTPPRTPQSRSASTSRSSSPRPPVVNTGDSPRLIMSPQAVRTLARSPLLINAITDAASEAERKQLQALYHKTKSHLIPPEVSHLLGVMGEAIGQGLMTVGASVTNQAADVALAVGATVGDQTEMLVSKAVETMPKYTENEVRQIMCKKDALLNELSRTVLLLGVAEDERLVLIHEAETLRQRETTLLEDNNRLFAQLEETNDHLASLRHEREEDRCHLERVTTEAAEWRRAATEQGHRCARLLENCAAESAAATRWKEQLESERSGFSEERDAWSVAMDRAREEQRAVRLEMKSVCESTLEKLAMVERERDAALAELAVLRDAISVDKARAEVEERRLKDAIINEQEVSKQRQLEIDTVLRASRIESSELRNRTDDLTQQLALAMQERAALETQCREGEIGALQLTGSLRESREEIRALRDQLSSAFSELQSERKVWEQELVRFRDLQLLVQTNSTHSLVQQEQLSESRRGREQAESRIAQLETMLEQAKKESLVTITQAAFAASQREAELTAHLNEAESTHKILMAEFQQVVAQNKTDMSNIDEITVGLRKECIRLESALREATVQHIAETDQLRRAAQAVEERLASLTIQALSKQKQLDLVGEQLEVEKRRGAEDREALYSQLSVMRVQLVQSQSEVQQLQDRVSSLTQEGEEVLGQSSEEVQRLQATITNLQNDLLSVKTSLALTAELERVRRVQTAAHVSARCGKMHEVVTGMRAELAAMRSDHTELVTLHHSVDRTSQQMHEILNQGVEQRELRLHSQLQAAKEQRASSVESQSAEALRVSQIEGQLSSLQHQFSVSKVELEASKRTTDSIRLELAVALQSRSELQTQLDYAHTALASSPVVDAGAVEADVALWKDRAEASLRGCRDLQAHALREQQQHYEQRLAELHSQLTSTLAAYMKDRSSMIANYEEQIATANHTKLAAEDKLRDISNDIEAHIRTRTAELTRERCVLSEQLVSTNARLEEALSLAKAREAQISELQRDVSQLKESQSKIHTVDSAKLSDMAIIHSQLQQQLEGLQNSLKSSHTDLIQKDHTIAGLVAQSQSLWDTVHRLESERDAINSQRAEVVRTLHVQSVALEQAERREAEYATTTSQYKAALHALEQRCVELQKRQHPAGKANTTEAAAFDTLITRLRETESRLLETESQCMEERTRRMASEDMHVRETEALRIRLNEAEAMLAAATESLNAGPSTGSSGSTDKDCFDSEECDEEEDRLIESALAIRLRELASVWHEQLVTLILDLHEAVTVAIFDMADDNQNRIGEVSQDDTGMSRLQHVSSTLHKVHLHAVSSVPWLRAVNNSKVTLSNDSTHVGGRRNSSDVELRVVLTLIMRAWRRCRFQLNQYRGTGDKLPRPSLGYQSPQRPSLYISGDDSFSYSPGPS